MSLKEKIIEMDGEDFVLLFLTALGLMMIIIPAVAGKPLEGVSQSILVLSGCMVLMVIQNLSMLHGIRAIKEKLEKRIQELEAKDAGEQRRQLPVHAGSGSDDEPPAETAKCMGLRPA